MRELALDGEDMMERTEGKNVKKDVVTESKTFRRNTLTQFCLNASQTRSLAPNYSPEEARFGLIHDGKSSELIFENHYSFFSADKTAYEAGLSTLHIREVMNSEISR
jgi:hypothetical protein